MADLLTPPGALRAVQDTASSVVSALPPPPAPAPGAPGAAAVGVPAPPDPVTPLVATGISNLVAPPPVNVPSIPGIGVPLPNEVPMPTDFLCSDWSAKRGDSAGAPIANTEIPRALITGTAPAGRDRWGNE
ncbi:hypothetical protein MDUV_17860 [Mycolicibacterium duvalii]|uniref:Uncharacterized protein n=1 Tax=Mycolicibacterium duvalii TaxID=39688 RepID=A0A7I7JYF6_9MYCO|nr:hypothetical protein MDUV_17860 [Mycolicibacterium duvalii]